MAFSTHRSATNGHIATSPEGMWFEHRAEEAGFARAVEGWDSGEPIAPDISRRVPGSP